MNLTCFSPTVQRILRDIVGIISNSWHHLPPAVIKWISNPELRQIIIGATNSSGCYWGPNPILHAKLLCIGLRLNRKLIHGDWWMSTLPAKVRLTGIDFPPDRRQESRDGRNEQHRDKWNVEPGWKTFGWSHDWSARKRCPSLLGGSVDYLDYSTNMWQSIPSSPLRISRIANFLRPIRFTDSYQYDFTFRRL